MDIANKVLPATTAKGIFWAIIAFLVLCILTDAIVRMVSRGNQSLLGFISNWGARIADPVVSRIAA